MSMILSLSEEIPLPKIETLPTSKMKRLVVEKTRLRTRLRMRMSLRLQTAQTEATVARAEANVPQPATVWQQATLLWGRHGRRMGGGDQGLATSSYFATPGYWDPPRGGGGPPHLRDPLGAAPQAHWGPPPPCRASEMGGGAEYMEPPIGLPMGGGRRLGGGGRMRGCRY